MDQDKKQPKKPAKNHPWRRDAGSKVHAWAKEQSQIMPVQNIVVSRPENLSDRKESKSKRGQF